MGLVLRLGRLSAPVCVSEDNAVAMNTAQLQLMNDWENQQQPVSATEFLQQLATAGAVDEASEAAVKLLLAEPLPKSQLKSVLTTPPSGLPGYVACGLSLLALLLAAVKLQESRRPGSSAVHRGFHPGTVLRHLGNPRLSVILGAVFVTTFGFAQFESTLSLLTQKFGYSSRWNYLLYAYVGFVLSLGQGLLVRRLLPRIGETRMALAGVLLMTVGFCLIALTGLKVLPGAALWAILPIIVIGFSSVNPSLQSLLSRAAGADEQGMVLGTGQSLSSLARILGPAIGIALLRQGAAFPYFLGAGLILCGGMLVSRIRLNPSATAEGEQRA